MKMAPFRQLLEQHIAASMEKQWALADRIGQAPWQLDLQAGTIVFGEKLQCRVQVLGTESEQQRTWTWGWSQTATTLPPSLLEAVEQLRAHGERTGAEVLTAAKPSLDDVDGHRLALVATGLCNADAYYRGPYEGGALFVLLYAPELRQNVTIPLMRMANVLTQIINLYELNHRLVLENYAAWKGWPVQPSAEGLQVLSPSGESLLARFDDRDRLVNLSTRIEPR